jgi:hypothetical protein
MTKAKKHTKHSHLAKHAAASMPIAMPPPTPTINALSEMIPFETSVGSTLKPMAPQYNPAPEAAPSNNADFADY